MYIRDREAAGCVPRWIEYLRSRRTHIVGHFGQGFRFLDLNDSRINQYRRRRLGEGCATETVNKELTVIGAAGRLAEREALIARLPWRKIERAVDRTGNEAWTYLTREEINRLLDVLKNGGAREFTRSNGRRSSMPVFYSETLLRRVVFLLNTGARADEMARLHWGDVDMANKRVRLVGSKSAKNGRSARGRHIGMNDQLLEMFESMDSGAKTELVFSRSCNLLRDFKAAQVTAGIIDETTGKARARVHDLRHTFASHLVMAGVPLYTVSELLGHASGDMTRRYAHLSPEAMRAAVAVLNFGEAREGAEVIAIGG